MISEKHDKNFDPKKSKNDSKDETSAEETVEETVEEEKDIADVDFENDDQ